MSRKIFAIMLCLFISMSVWAQQTTRTKEKKEEITIKKKAGDEKKGRDEKMTIIIDGDKITVNGKPLAEYKGDQLVIRHNDLDNLKIELDREGDNLRNMKIQLDRDDMARMHDGMAMMERDLRRSLSPGMMERELQRSLAPKMREMERMRIEGHPAPWGEDFDFDFNFEGSPEMKMMMDGKPRTQLGVSLEKADKGVKITDVMSESPAAKAGLKEGDVIVKFNGKAVTEPQALSTMVQEKKPDDQVEVTYIPSGQKKEKKLTVKLGASAPQAFSFKSPNPRVRVTPGAPYPGRSWGGGDDNMMRDAPGEFFFRNETRRPMLGIKIQDMEDSSGVKVLDVDDDSPAATAGIKEDDVITQIDGQPVKNTDDAREVLHQAGAKNLYSVNVKRNGTPMTLQVKLPVKLKKAEL